MAELNPAEEPRSNGAQQLQDNPNWMASCKGLHEACIGDIIWPGTHDSGAHCEEFDYGRVVSEDRLRSWGTYILNRVGHTPRMFVSGWTRTQNLSVYKQLEHGVRFLDLRVSKCLEDGVYYIVHSFCGPNVESVLKEVVSFMAKNTKECILIEVVPCSFVDHAQLYGMFEQLLGDLMLQRETHTVSPFSLKMSYLLERGRIVVFYKFPEFDTHKNTLPAFWDSGYMYAPFLMSMEPEAKETYQLERFSHFKSLTAQVDNPQSSRMFHFMYALTPRLNEIVWSLFRRHDDHTHPSSLEACAQKINPRLGKFLETILDHSSDSRKGGVVVTIDYVEQSELVQLAIALNQERLKKSHEDK